MSEAEFDDLFSLIKSNLYPNNKNKHLIGMAKMLQEEFGGIVPMKVEELVKTTRSRQKNSECNYFRDRSTAEYGC